MLCTLNLDLFSLSTEDFVRLFLFHLVWRPSTYFSSFINHNLLSHLYLPGLAVRQIHILIDTQLVAWLEAMPIMHIFMAWQADRPPPSDTIIQSKHQTSSRLWCGPWVCSLQRGIFWSPVCTVPCARRCSNVITAKQLCPQRGGRSILQVLSRRGCVRE